MSDIFREIDEELRRDNLLKLWSRYWPYIAGVVAFALLFAGGFVLWRNYQISVRQAQSTHYAATLGLVAEGKPTKAAEKFAAIGKEGGGYAVLAPFEEAALLARSGHGKRAVAVYDQVARSSVYPVRFRDLAILLSAMNQLPATDPNALIQRLKPLTAAGNPWRPTALDLTAAIELEAGKKSAARKIYQGLADDLEAPPDLRARAAEMAAALAP